MKNNRTNRKKLKLKFGKNKPCIVHFNKVLTQSKIENAMAEHGTLLAPFKKQRPSKNFVIVFGTTEILKSL